MGGRDPGELAQATDIAVREYGFLHVNLNCGCPSKSVSQEHRTGAYMMIDRENTMRCLEAMKEAAAVAGGAEISVKCRIGVDDVDSYEDLASFVRDVRSAGVTRLQLHARKALLDGVGTMGNRHVPPLRHDVVHSIARDFPNLMIELNGGILSSAEGLQCLRTCPELHGVMCGRAAINHPFSFANIDHEWRNNERLESGDVSGTSESHARDNSVTAAPLETMAITRREVLRVPPLVFPAFFTKFDRALFAAVAHICCTSTQVLERYIDYCGLSPYVQDDAARQKALPLAARVHTTSYIGKPIHASYLPVLLFLYVDCSTTCRSRARPGLQPLRWRSRLHTLPENVFETS
jgi:tRNA-dihydrouridine synthase